MAFFKYFLGLCLAIASLVLSGCSSLPEAPKDAMQWQGRFSVQISDGVRNERNSGTFVFQKYSTARNLDLYGPLGVTVAKISVNEKRATLERPGEEPLTSNNAENLTSLAIGYPIPIDQLSAWLEGKPISSRPFKLLPEKKGFEQAGWTVLYTYGENQKITRITVTSSNNGQSIKLILLLH